MSEYAERNAIDRCLALTVHETFMHHALDEAQHAAAIGEVPVGAVIVRAGDLLSTGFNTRQRDQDPSAHAEMVAIRRASERTGSWRLDDCVLYVTLEPCPMCAGAILLARIPCVVYGAGDPKAGAVRSLYTLLDDPRLNHRCEIIEGVLAEACGALLTDFFRARRAEGKK